MPRSTHPSSPRKHDRGQLREQRSRYIRRRWRRNKGLYRIDEGSGAMVVDMNAGRVQRKCGEKTLRELADVLGQKGPLLFLHPEPLRHAPKELRRKVEKCLGLHVLGANEMASPAAAHDKRLAEAILATHAERPTITARPRRKRLWRRESVNEILAVDEVAEIAEEGAEAAD